MPDENDIIMKGVGHLLEENDRLVEERDETRSWTLRIANLLGVDTSDCTADTVAEGWKKLRGKIEKHLKKD